MRSSMGSGGRGWWAALLAFTFCVGSDVGEVAAIPAGEAAREPVARCPISVGIRGGPWASNLFDLAPFGYVEEEYFITGTASSYAEGGTEGMEAAYRTRVLVRRPVDAADFNGTVVVEWLNVTGTFEIDIDWVYAYELLLREGYAFVGVSAQQIGVMGGPLSLKTWDPVRYATLHHPGDDWSFDIYSQAAQAIRHPEGADPLGGLRVERVLAAGASQSGGHLVRYVNRVHSEARVFDGFFVHSGDGFLRDDLDVPVFKVMAENEDIPLNRQPDTPFFRLWEEAGSAHSVQYWWDYFRQVVGRDVTAPVPSPELWSADPFESCPHPVNRYPRQYVARAALHHLNAWVRDGTLPPVADHLHADGETVERDQHGNALGGLRLPTVDVPVATYTTDDGCFINHGSTEYFSVDELRSLYPTREDYLSAVGISVATALEAGFLLPEEAEEMRQGAAPPGVWSP